MSHSYYIHLLAVKACSDATTRNDANAEQSEARHISSAYVTASVQGAPVDDAGLDDHARHGIYGNSTANFDEHAPAPVATSEGAS
eukprot:692-Pleurochrysis_carterae.AAC.1